MPLEPRTWPRQILFWGHWCSQHALSSLNATQGVQHQNKQPQWARSGKEGHFLVKSYVKSQVMCFVLGQRVLKSTSLPSEEVSLCVPAFLDSWQPMAWSPLNPSLISAVSRTLQGPGHRMLFLSAPLKVVFSLSGRFWGLHVAFLMHWVGSLMFNSWIVFHVETKIKSLQACC